MNISYRDISDFEHDLVYSGIPFFAFKKRKMAKEEFLNGKVEIIEFKVNRAWNLITCAGPPCCPNEWFLDLGDDIFAVICSWDFLQANNEKFSGENVKIEVLPLTRRIIDVSYSGNEVDAPLLEGQPRYTIETKLNLFQLFKKEKLPQEIIQVIA